MRRTCSTARAPASATATAEVLDHMAWDGLTNPYDGKAMGVFGEGVRRQVRFTRARRMRSRPNRSSARRPRIASGAFDDEIVPVTVKGRKGDVVVDTDEAARQVRRREDPGTARRRSARTAR